ncbi:hypothetical protein SKAU_G00125560 [Synaphobranchus kaupii]|uniref:Uncharacterized protein n=1 Tax=Synaphobranchus kaupii TaxID=118154 RepID=A0A9Q1J2Y2_SYNKA|nr:hypothetical protein SKAU_G00125560 [Synaphobranchus kaupii]
MLRSNLRLSKRTTWKSVGGEQSETTFSTYSAGCDGNPLCQYGRLERVNTGSAQETERKRVQLMKPSSL